MVFESISWRSPAMRWFFDIVYLEVARFKVGRDTYEDTSIAKAACARVLQRESMVQLTTDHIGNMKYRQIDYVIYIWIVNGTILDEIQYLLSTSNFQSKLIDA